MKDESIDDSSNLGGIEYLIILFSLAVGALGIASISLSKIEKLEKSKKSLISLIGVLSDGPRII